MHHTPPEGPGPGMWLSFIVLTALGMLIFGAVTHFVLTVLFGLGVSFGQSLGIGVVLGMILSTISR